MASAGSGSDDDRSRSTRELTRKSGKKEKKEKKDKKDDKLDKLLASMSGLQAHVGTLESVPG